MKLITKRFINLPVFLCCFTFLFTTACSQRSDLQSPQEEGVLKIVTRNSPTTYFEGPTGPTGFEYALAKKFADYIGVKLEVTVNHDLGEIFETLHEGKAHIAAAGITITEPRKKTLAFSPSYLEIQQQVLYRFNKYKPKNIGDLIGHSIQVLANSSHNETLRQLKTEYPELSWRATKDVETTDLLDGMTEGKISYTLVDSNEYMSLRAIYPNVKVAFNIGEPQQLAWAFSKSVDNEKLQKQLTSFFKKISNDGTLAKLQERFYSPVKQINAVGLRTFNKNIESRLPKYLPLIKTIAEENDMPWQLLAAISYQESHWRRKAKSPTGVRGMMMLTWPTAKEMGVKNRLNAEQSLRGGARYYKKVLAKIPKRIPDPDRTWFALAAYNIGYGHLEDARKITEGQGGNPDNWADVKSRLPLLAKSRYYKYTKFGYARGYEALTYVQNIRQYYDILSLSEQAETRRPPPKNVDQYVPDRLKNGFDAL